MSRNADGARAGTRGVHLDICSPLMNVPSRDTSSLLITFHSGGWWFGVGGAGGDAFRDVEKREVLFNL